jgi:hypothetical protein
LFFFFTSTNYLLTFVVVKHLNLNQRDAAAAVISNGRVGLT